MRFPTVFCVVLTVAAVSSRAEDPNAPEPGVLRVATYNVAMYRDEAGLLSHELAAKESPQAEKIAEVLQRVRPDVVLLCEIDFFPEQSPAKLFVENFTSVAQADGLKPLDYGYHYAAPVNTGEPSGLDLDGDGATDGPADAWGYGRYPGQYGMAVLSRHPIDEKASRTFQRLKWAELPDARRPVLPGAGQPYYTDEVWRQVRLPSKTVMDVVVQIGKWPLHLVCSHPTPPVFDGPEDRNGLRNADEIRLVREYITGGLASYFLDDAGGRGPLAEDDDWIVLGDLNADPFDGGGLREPIRRLLEISGAPAPTSVGGVEGSQRFAMLNRDHGGDPREDTGNFGPDGHGNLRIDYALPCPKLRVVGSGVYWPRNGEPGAEAAAASDHRLVWVDVALP